MSEAEQAVVEDTETEPEVQNEEDGAQEEESLDSLLAEFEDDSSDESQSKDDSVSKDDLKDVLQYVKGERERAIQENSAKEMQETVKSIKGDLEIPDEVVEGLLHARANKNAKLTTAYMNRKSNPDGWSKVEKSIHRDLKKIVDGLSKKSSEEGKKRVAEAVRSASTANPEVGSEDISKMSNPEFMKYKQKLFKDS